jgi:hypothetical protein
MEKIIVTHSQGYLQIIFVVYNIGVKDAPASSLSTSENRSSLALIVLDLL